MATAPMPTRDDGAFDHCAPPHSLGSNSHADPVHAPPSRTSACAAGVQRFRTVEPHASASQESYGRQHVTVRVDSVAPPHVARSTPARAMSSRWRRDRTTFHERMDVRSSSESSAANALRRHVMIAEVPDPPVPREQMAADLERLFGHARPAAASRSRTPVDGTLLRKRWMPQHSRSRAGAERVEARPPSVWAC